MAMEESTTREKLIKKILDMNSKQAEYWLHEIETVKTDEQGIPYDEPTEEERKLIDDGMKDLRNGDVISLDEIRNES